MEVFPKKKKFRGVNNALTKKKMKTDGPMKAE
jgi:hypothetical protein